ncbi:putative methyl-accepting chemotaxis protein [Desulfamplus magnetovallimortis]|uniref:Putative methyl-accepting chemotaxis protein n=1 Tax=Desulfamplus magnetovallimortis TaxID=1246637 RepID=A0A1W1H996_9BACT|nr:hypothetical protein [Desulfamplus magnetovallimortis]SLM29019.1 putative methyl-accepting chemotaxis protein [Desulfamplus magnetovallimortis]
MINPIHAYTPSTQTSSAAGKTTDTEQGQLFRNLLEKASGEESGRVGQNNFSPLGEISSPFNLTIEESPGILESQTDELLSKLELYSRKLDNPEVTLKEMSTLLEDIYKNAQSLLQETENTEGLSENDAALKDIACHCAITAQSEYIKFQRGDYL